MSRFDESVPLREREFYSLSIAGTAINFVGLTISLLQGAPLYGIAVVGGGALTMLLCTIYGYLTRQVEIMFNIMLVIINIFEFPIMFLMIIGLEGGICNYFVMGLMLTAMLMKTRGRSLLIVSTMIIDLSVMIYWADGKSEFIISNLNGNYIEKMISYIAVGIFIILVSSITENEHARQNGIIMKLNEELHRQSELDPLTQVFNR